MIEQLLTKELLNKGVETFTREFAWKYNEAIEVLSILKNKGIVVLGGDVLNLDLNYTYDNWYFDIDKNNSHDFNVLCSYEKSKCYIEQYYNQFGDMCYYIIVPSIIGDGLR